MKSTKRTLLMSVLSTVLCVAMLMGLTFAWFTDSATSGVNKIVAGNLDITVEYTNDNGTTWADLQGSASLFSGNLWEPGHTEYVTLKVTNNGTLALNYKALVTPVSESGGVNVNGQNFKLSDYLVFGTTSPAETLPTYTRETARAAVGETTGLTVNDLTQTGTLAAGATAYITLVVYMPETVGNEANYLAGTAAPSIELAVKVLAAQKAEEEDTFGNDYDEDAITVPEYVAGAYYDYFEAVYVSAASNAQKEFEVKKNIGSTEDVLASAIGETENAGESVELVVVKSTEATKNFVVEEGEEVKGFEIKVTGQKEGSLVKTTLYVGNGLSNFKLFHDGVEMTAVASAAALANNNEYFYNATTGYVVFATTSFSPFQATYVAPVAAIGATPYGGLQDAFDAAKAGDTVTLLKDVIATLPNAFGYNNEPVFEIMTGITLNGNGKSVIADSENWAIYNNKITGLLFSIGSQNNVTYTDSASVTIKDLTVVGHKNMKHGISVVKSSNANTSLTLDNVNISNCGANGISVNGTTVTLKNVTTANCGWGGVNVDKGGNLTVESGNYDMVYTENAESNVIVIKGGVFAVDPSAYVVSGFVSEKNGNLWVVSKVKPVMVEVTVGSTSTNYDTWNEAVAAVKNVNQPITMKLLNSGSVEAWESFVINGYQGQTIVLDGNNQTITGLKNMLFAGTWAGAGITVKDLTIDGANIVVDASDATESVGVGAIVGTSDSSANITIENVKLTNSHIEGGHWTGGFIGYVTGYNAAGNGPVFNNTVITDCVVENTEITGKGSCGALIGHACGNPATKVTVTSCTVAGNTATCTGSSTNKAGYLFGTVGNAGLTAAWNGEMGGVFVTNCTVNGNTATSNTTVIERVYGRIASGKLTVDSKEYTA